MKMKSTLAICLLVLSTTAIIWGRTRAEALSPASSLAYSTFLGGSLVDGAQAVAVDGAGNIYLTGYTDSSNFPASGGFGGETDVFIAKLGNNGASLDYALLLGGSDAEWGTDIVVDAGGNAYVTGWTASANFPATNGFDPTFGGVRDAFVAKINPSGAVIFASYLGGSQQDEGWGLALAGDRLHVAGFTESADFPITGDAYDSTLNSLDAFVAIIEMDGSAIEYGTYLGGSSEDAAWDIAVDSNQAIYLSGLTFSSDFPITPGVFAPFYNGGDGFLVKFRQGQADLDYSTYIGGEAPDDALALALDSSGNVYVTGSTQSATFPATADAFDETYNGAEDAFVIKITPWLTASSDLLYATYIGGSGPDRGVDIAIDSAGVPRMIGSTSSTDLPATGVAPGPLHQGEQDAFMVAFSPGGSSAYISYLGGAGADTGEGLALDMSGHIYLTGQTYSADFPVQSGAFTDTYRGEGDAFAARLTAITPTTTTVDIYAWGHAPGTPSANRAATIDTRYGNLGATPAQSVTLTAELGSGLSYQADTSGITPVQAGRSLLWSLPDLAYLGAGQFHLTVSNPALTGTTTYPVTLTLTANSSPANLGPTPNSMTVSVTLGGPVYLPIVIK